MDNPSVVSYRVLHIVTGGVNAATNRRTRDEGSDKEGEDGKGDGDTMVLAVMDGATLTA